MVTTVTVSMSEFGRMLGLSRQTVAQHVAEGMPAGPAGRGVNGRQVPFAAAQRWLVDRAVARARAHDGGETLRQAETRKARADADLAEAKVAALREQMVPAAVATAAFAACLRSFDAAAEAMIDRLVPRIAVETSPAVLRQMALDEARRARARMAGDLDGQA